MLGIFIAFLIAICTLYCFYARRKFNYWQSRGVRVPPYLPVFGHIYHLFFKGHRWEYIEKIYKEYEDKRFWGMYEFFSPVVHIKDPDLIKDIFVKNANHFVNRRTLDFPKKDKIANEMLFNIKGEEWKALRSLMSPSFSSGKMKGMYPLIYSLAGALVTKCNIEILKDSYVRMNSVFIDYAMDVVASCSFGIESSCLLGEKSEFSTAARKGIASTISITETIKLSMLVMLPKLYGFLGLSLGGETMQIFINAIKHTLNIRRESGIRRGDFIDLMLEALKEHEKLEHSNKYPMTYNTIVSQSLLFLIAGLETTANTISFTTHLLAKNPECQSKLRKELQKIEEADGGFTYQNVMEAQYLDACLSESLRMFPPAFFIERICTQKYRIPGTELDIEEFMSVAVPVWSLHYDPKYWDEPTKYNPERFLPENKQNIVPYAYMPFGHGPRNCIGMRFAQMEAKLALAKLSTNFELSLKPGFEEIIFNKSPTILRPEKDGIWLKLTKLK